MPDLQLPPAYILCGGRSERFGTDKALVEIAGQTQLLRLTAALKSAGHQVAYVADRADRYQQLDINCLSDTLPNAGPLAGLATALTHRAAWLAADQSGLAAGWLWLINCDQTQWNPAWNDELLAAIQQRSLVQPGHPVVACAYHDATWQPLPALYHCHLISQVQQRLISRQLSLHGLLDELDQAGQAIRLQSDATPRKWSFNTRTELTDLL